MKPAVTAQPEMATATKERGIPFRAEMVRAIIDNRKSQTRRIVNPQPPSGVGIVNAEYCGHPEIWLAEGNVALCREKIGISEWKCPYGGPGDRLWVRETYIPRANGTQAIYRADYDAIEAAGLAGMYSDKGWTPPIHMFRKFSRIVLEITKVRVERVHQISDAGALAEGVDPIHIEKNRQFFDRRDIHALAYGELWNRIHGKDPAKCWKANPWVWVVEFNRAKCA